MLNNQSVLDTRQLITGKDGQLFVTSKSKLNVFLAEVNEFKAQLNVKNIDYQPVGSAEIFAVPTGYSVTLTLTEAIVRDDVMLEPFIKDLQEGYFPCFDFQGKARRREGQEERVIFRNCIPDGNVDLISLNPGDIIKREWSFRCNDIPQLFTNFVYAPTYEQTYKGYQ